jgi:hypothetical protein
MLNRPPYFVENHSQNSANQQGAKEGPGDVSISIKINNQVTQGV